MGDTWTAKAIHDFKCPAVQTIGLSSPDSCIFFVDDSGIELALACPSSSHQPRRTGSDDEEVGLRCFWRHGRDRIDKWPWGLEREEQRDREIRESRRTRGGVNGNGHHQKLEYLFKFDSERSQKGAAIMSTMACDAWFRHDALGRNVEEHLHASSIERSIVRRSITASNMRFHISVNETQNMGVIKMYIIVLAVVRVSGA
jgi:hypothetical protein